MGYGLEVVGFEQGVVGCRLCRVRTRGGGVRIKGGSVQTPIGHISLDQHFHTDDTSLPSIDEE